MHVPCAWPQYYEFHVPLLLPLCNQKSESDSHTSLNIFLSQKEIAFLEMLFFSYLWKLKDGCNVGSGGVSSLSGEDLSKFQNSMYISLLSFIVI